MKKTTSKLTLKRTSITELSPRQMRIAGGLVVIQLPGFPPGLPGTPSHDPNDPLSIDCNASCGLTCGGGDY